MKTSNLFLWTFALVLTTFFSACDDDDNVSDPVGTIALNMLNEDYGKTLLEDASLYIDNANNFVGSYNEIVSLGRKSGLGAVSGLALSGMSTRVAVEPGCAYQVFDEYFILEFPSGNKAVHIDANYYNLYVTSYMMQENVVVGANVKFVHRTVPRYGLPERDTDIGTLDYRYGGVNELTFDLPTADFECKPNFWGDDYYTIEYEQKGEQLIVRLINRKKSGSFGFYIRMKDSYTYIQGEVV